MGFPAAPMNIPPNLQGGVGRPGTGEGGTPWLPFRGFPPEAFGNRPGMGYRGLSPSYGVEDSTDDTAFLDTMPTNWMSLVRNSPAMRSNASIQGGGGISGNPRFAAPMFSPAYSVAGLGAEQREPRRAAAYTAGAVRNK